MALAWSAVHGYGRLLIDGQLEALHPSLARDAFLGDVADRVLVLVGRAFDPTGDAAGGHTPTA